MYACMVWTVHSLNLQGYGKAQNQLDFNQFSQIRVGEVGRISGASVVENSKTNLIIIYVMLSD